MFKNFQLSTVEVKSIAEFKSLANFLQMNICANKPEEFDVGSIRYEEDMSCREEDFSFEDPFNIDFTRSRYSLCSSSLRAQPKTPDSFSPLYEIPTMTRDACKLQKKIHDCVNTLPFDRLVALQKVQNGKLSSDDLVLFDEKLMCHYTNVRCCKCASDIRVYSWSLNNLPLFCSDNCAKI